MELDELIAFIRETATSLKCPPGKLKGYEPEDREIIRAEENGYAVLADTLVQRLRARAAMGARDV